MKKNVDFVLGVVVLGVAAWFFVLVSSGGIDADEASVVKYSAQFGSVTGLRAGSAVQIGGVAVGEVQDIQLDPVILEALVTVQVRGDIRLPADSSIQVVSDGLFGGKFLRIVPGGADTFLADGDSFTDVASALALEELIGRAVLSLGD